MRRKFPSVGRAGRAMGAVAAIATAIVLATTTPATAHPLGNFTNNIATAVTVKATGIETQLVLDLAEIPALQTKQRIDTDDDDEPSEQEQTAYRTSMCKTLSEQLFISVDGEAVVQRQKGSRVSFPPGQAGLTTLRLECEFEAEAVITDEADLEIRSTALADRVGWREITIAGDRMTISDSDVSATSPSATLTKYPEAKLQSPLRQDSAKATVRPGGPALDAGDDDGPVVPLPRGIDAPTRAFTSFVGRQDLNVGVGMAAFALSLLLGAIHAMAPGHGKTVMAAYLVGQKGSPRQAAVLGLTVTATHTLGVLALGIAIAASKIVTPERLYPYLGVISGLLLAAIGVNLLRNARRARRALRPNPARHDHDHHDHEHDDHDHHEHDDHEHDHHEHDHHEQEHEEDDGWHAHGGGMHRHAPIVPGQPLTWSSLLALGFVGGFLPSPSAVVVLLGAIALGRAWFGVLLVVAYGLGMAGTLMAAGLLLVRARGALERRLHRVLDRDGSRVLNTLLPFGTALVIIVVGLVLAAQGANSISG